MVIYDLAIIGSGMAAIRLVDALRRRGDQRSILVVGDERALPYNRILLSPLLSGEIDWQQLVTHPAEWYVEHNVELRLGQPVMAIERAGHTLVLADGQHLGYRQLVIATGSRAARPHIPGIDLRGVCSFRDIADVTRLQQAVSRGGRAVVLGGGLLGLEAAVALATRGMQTTLVHRSPLLMNRQLDATAAGYLQRAIEARGVRVVTGSAPQAIEGDFTPCAVRLASGERIAADLVVTATGIEPVTALACGAGLDVSRGIVVDEQLRTSDANIFAIGECCELNGETVGLVAPIWQQVEVLAAVLCGDQARFEAQPYVTMLKVSGIDVHVMGESEAGDGRRAITYQDRARGIYKKLILRDRNVVGALLYGDVADSQLFFNLIQRRTAIDSGSCRLLLAGELHEPAQATA
jgi:nitrite reductase (NADH) large subunit